MPNWCNNSINIVGPTSKIKDLWARANTSVGFQLLNAMVPQPEDLSDDPEYDRALSATPDWYSWRVRNWGTKWDINDEGLGYEEYPDDTAAITGWFDSAWAPPVEAIRTYLQANDDVIIELDYHEPGMCFVGRLREDCDEYYEYSDCTSDNIKEFVGEEICDEWDLESLLAEYEEWEDDDTIH